MKTFILISCLVLASSFIFTKALPAEIAENNLKNFDPVKVEEKSEVLIKNQPVIDLEVVKNLSKIEENGKSDEEIETFRRGGGGGGSRGSASGLSSLSFLNLLTFIALVCNFA